MHAICFQISQMVVGIGLNWYGYKLKSRGEVCDLNWESIYAAGAVYFSYPNPYIQKRTQAKTKTLLISRSNTNFLAKTC